MFKHNVPIGVVELPSLFSDILYRHGMVMAVEAAAFHESRLRRHPDDYGPNIRKLLEGGSPAPRPEYARCKERSSEAAGQEMLACFEGSRRSC